MNTQMLPRDGSSPTTTGDEPRRAAGTNPSSGRRLERFFGVCLLLALLLAIGCGSSRSPRAEGDTRDDSRFRISPRNPPVRLENELKLDQRGLFGSEPKPVIPNSPPPEGIALQDLMEGIGKFSGPHSRLTFQYAVYDYASGRKLISSWDEGKSRTVTLGRGKLIDGLEEGLLELETADRREIVVPPAFAIGGWPAAKIPEGATSVFVVDLLAVS